MKERSPRRHAPGVAMVVMMALVSDAGSAFCAPLAAPERTAERSTASLALTLEQCVEQALKDSPSLQAAEAQLREAQGRLAGAETYPFNPVLDGEAASRNGAGESTTDFAITLGQEVQLAGQRGRRIETSRAELSAERANLERTKRILVAQVHSAFITALAAGELLGVARSDLDLAERLHELAQRRLERGAGTQLDVNVAAAERGRAEARFRAAEADSRRARAALAETIGLPPSSLPLPQGRLQADLEPVPDLTEVLDSARAQRADLQALATLQSASRARYASARSEAWPNLTLRIFGGREEGTDRIIGGGLSVPLPLFQRNQGSIDETLAGIQRAQAELRAGEISVDREVIAAHARYQAGVKAAEELRRLVLGTLEQSLDLLQRSFEAGKATWPEVIVIRRTLVDAQRELAAAEAEARLAWTQLQLASGRMPLPEQSAPGNEQ